jgi:hypothetical protein
MEPLCECRRSDDEVLGLAFESTGAEPSFTIVEYLDEHRNGDYVEEYVDVDVIRERAFAVERDHRNVRRCRIRSKPWSWLPPRSESDS